MYWLEFEKDVKDGNKTYKDLVIKSDGTDGRIYGVMRYLIE